jgi:hypothetical protein
MIPVAIECPKQSIVLVNNLDHQCIKTSTNVPISCITSEVEKSQLLCDNIGHNCRVKVSCMFCPCPRFPRQTLSREGPTEDRGMTPRGE